VEELLSGKCIQMPIKGAVAILEPNLPRLSVSAQQLYEELWREAKSTEKAIHRLEDSQIKLNQQVASIETAIAKYRVDASGPFLDQFKADLEVLDSLGKSLPEKVLTWGRDPLSNSVWSELKSIQQQVKQSADHLAEERAAAAIIHDLLQEARPKLAEAKARAQALSERLQTAPFDPQVEMRPPVPDSADLLQAWLEKLQASAQAGYPAKRVVHALRAWNARLEEFDSAVHVSRKKLDALEQESSECHGLYQALLVKSERKGLLVKEKAGALSAKLEAAFAAKAVNLAEVKRLIKSFVEVLC
jgi:DNA repair exonuclease SbcCD ATPase subunit